MKTMLKDGLFEISPSTTTKSQEGAFLASKMAFLTNSAAADLKCIRQAHLDAFRYALPCAYDKRAVAAIHAAWDSMEAGQP